MRAQLYALVAIAFALSIWATDARAERVDIHLRRLETVGDAIRAPYLKKTGAVEVTLDPVLQEKMVRLLKGSRAPAGAIVMSDASTGRILAWATRGGDADLVRIPRYPGASIYKVVTAASLLEAEHTFRGTKHCYGGGLSGLSASDVESLCKPGEDKMAFGEALGHSINVIFGRLAVAHLEPDDLHAMGAGLGFGKPVPIDIPARTVTMESAGGRPWAGPDRGWLWSARRVPIGRLVHDADHREWWRAGASDHPRFS